MLDKKRPNNNSHRQYEVITVVVTYIPMGVPPKVKYKEKFDKEMKGQRPQYDLKESKIYKTLKDANTLASEVNLTCHF